MSHFGDARSNTHKLFSGAGVDSISDRLGAAALSATERDKPDTKDFDFGSPVSPLVNNRTASSSTAITHTSSSSSSSGSVTGRTLSNALVRTPDAGPSRTQSGELTLSRENSPSAAEGTGSGGSRASKPGHRRSCSGPLIYSGSSGGGGGIGGSVNSPPPTNVLPAGNICPSGKITKTGMMSRTTTRSDVLGSGTVNYGHGSIIRGGVGKPVAGDMPPMGSNDPLTVVRRALATSDPEEVNRVANELYRKGQFAEALKLYDRAISICPDNMACRTNKAAALTGMGRLAEAVRECEEAVRLDPTYGRAHQRLVSLHLRLGQVANARRHLHSTREPSDPMEMQKLQTIERHLNRCADARRIGDWKTALRESDAAIAAGADSSHVLIASKAEALLRLHRLNEADSTLSNTAKLESLASSFPQNRIFGMLPISYLYVVRAQVEMELGRFENAELAAEKAHESDPQNREVATVLNKARSVARARAHGNDLFNSGNFAEACIAYGEGLKLDPSNPVLHCNRAACYSRLGQWEKSAEDCNEALKFQPNYTKALLRRAASYAKLERWAESVRDYEVLRKELPADTDIAEALFHAQVAWKASRGEDISNMKFGGEVEKILSMEQFHAAISLPGISLVHFMSPLDKKCLQISPFVDALSTRYPSLNFLKVDTNECPSIAKSENVKIVPTFKIYKNGTRMKEMICPSTQVLEYSVRHYGL